MPPRIGARNSVRVRVRNVGGTCSGLPMIALRDYRLRLPNHVADRKTTRIGELAAGEKRNFTIEPIRFPQDGPWEIGVAVDATQAMVESRGNNNAAVFNDNDMSAARPGPGGQACTHLGATRRSAALQHAALLEAVQVGCAAYAPQRQ